MATKTATVVQPEATDTREEGPDAPLLDTLGAELKKLVQKGKERGYITYDELNAALPPDEVSSEQIEDTMAMLSEAGVNVIEAEEQEETAAANPAEPAKTAVVAAEATGEDEELGRTDDPVRMYLREMGSVELLSREGEIEIAKRIEAGQDKMIGGICESPMTITALLTWRDASRNVQVGGTGAFRDAVAVQFPGNPATGIPYFAMGEPNKPVVIYQWKADWQFGNEGDEEGLHPQMVADWYPYSGRASGEIAAAVDYAKGGDRTYVTSWHAGNSLGDRDLQASTTIEKLEAEGFGTLTALPADRQDGHGKAAWKDGVWSLLVMVPRTQDRFAFAPGMTIPVAFAAWDGARRERGGEKAVSTWYFMSLEKPIGTLAYISPVLAFLGVAAVQAWSLRWLRRRAEQGGDREA